MTVLLEIKQKIKGLYGQYEIYILPFLKFALALVYFTWINVNMGYMPQLKNVFIVLVLALICSILPPGAMIFIGFIMMLGHSYALGIEVAAFMLVLILLALILFLRFSSDANIVLVFSPLAFAFELPAMLPLGSGLLSGAVSAIPAGCGAIFFYFIRFLHAQAQVLQNTDLGIMGKLTLLTDGLVQNWEMWITVVAFVLTTLLVNLIRTRAFDYAWRIAIVAGGVTYILITLLGSFYFDINVSVVSVIGFSVIAMLISFVLEFVVFGGDYTRTERLEYEDDEYYYYVKAVPKAFVATSDRSIKKINAEPEKEEKEQEEQVVTYVNPLFPGDAELQEEGGNSGESDSVVETAPVEKYDYEKKLEESLRDL